MPLSLITDRTQAQVDELKAIRAKLNTGVALTTAEQASWEAGKGGNNVADLNRVGSAVAMLRDILAEYGYTVNVTPKTDWEDTDTPQRVIEMAVYLRNVQTLKDAFYGSTPLPTSMVGITVTDLNNIEQLLLEIETNINNMIAALWRCGELRCGE
jgi:hypothetical protein